MADSHRYPVIPRSPFTSNPIGTHARVAQWCNILLSENLFDMGNVGFVVMILSADVRMGSYIIYYETYAMRGREGNFCFIQGLDDFVNQGSRVFPKGI